jgi:hypothetical protein
MIYFGSCSDSGFRQYLAQFFNKMFFLHNLAISMSEAALFPRKLASHFFYFLPFLFHFMLDPDDRPKFCSRIGSSKAKSYGSCGSGVPVLQHCFYILSLRKAIAISCPLILALFPTWRNFFLRLNAC